jgi:hypothetical protein
MEKKKQRKELEEKINLKGRKIDLSLNNHYDSSENRKYENLRKRFT